MGSRNLTGGAARAPRDTIQVHPPPEEPRPFCALDGFIYGVYANSIVIAASLTCSLAWPWPDAHIPLAIVFICLAFFPAFTVYAMLTTLMPRHGGDYAWQTRGLGAFWGFILVFTPLLVGPWFYMASNVAPGSSMVMGPLLVSLAELLRSQALIDFANHFETRIGTWWFYVFYVSFAALILAAGMRIYARIQRVCFVLGCIALASWAAMLLALPAGGFPAAFDAFMADVFAWGEGDAYGLILEMARSKGYEAVPLSETSISSSLLVGPVLAYVFMYVAWTGTMAGEISGVRRLRNSMGIYLGGNIFSMIVCAGFTWLLISRIGNEFFTSANFLWATGNHRDIPLAPHTGVFLMALSQSPLAWLWVGLGLSAWFWIWPTNNMVMSTRVMMAMSHDRVLPGFLSTLSRRQGTPLAAIGVCYLGSLVLGWLYFFTDFSTLTLNMPLMTAIAFAASTLVGTLFPWLPATRHLYRGSSVSRFTILGAPLITVMGGLGLAYFAVLFYLYVSDSRYGTNNPLSAIFILGFIAVSALLFVVLRYVRKRSGIDLERALAHIPPAEDEPDRRNAAEPAP